ncbi:MAG: 6-phosphogluconolactonase [Candidatus Hydrogenedentota bacterium]
MPYPARHYETIALFHQAVRDLVAETLQHDGGPHLTLISGGSTPVPIYERITADPFPVNPVAHIAFADERHVRPDNPASNYGTTLPMLAALALPEDRVLHVNTAQPIADAAADYEHQLTRFLDAGGTIRLALLGLGIDGHTCSLFTVDDLRDAEGHYAIPVHMASEPDRVSVTPALLRRAERVVFLVAGEEKTEICDILRNEPETIVAGLAVRECPRVEIWQA